MQNTYANESFMDELAAASKQDPLLFRLKHLSGERAVAVLNRVAKLSGWESRPSPAPQAGTGRLLKGRGVAYVRYEGNRTYVALTAEVEVERATGKVHVTRICVSHDCGLVINPDGLRNQIEGGVIQSASWTLREQVHFDRNGILSQDWSNYPILTMLDVPRVETVLIDRPNERALGAGEAAQGPTAAAIANAFAAATGRRIRELPLTPERVKAALA